jgi:YD repeat-containing protein
MSYDAAGRLIRITSPNGVKTTASDDDFAAVFGYDALDRVIEQTRHEVNAGGTITASQHQHSCYDGAGNLRWAVAGRANLASVDCAAPSPPAHTTRYSYDLAHRLLSVTDALGRQRSFAYDANGNRTTITNEAGDPQTLVYDERDQLSKRTVRFVAGATPRDLTTK